MGEVRNREKEWGTREGETRGEKQGKGVRKTGREWRGKEQGKGVRKTGGGRER